MEKLLSNSYTVNFCLLS